MVVDSVKVRLREELEGGGCWRESSSRLARGRDDDCPGLSRWRGSSLKARRDAATALAEAVARQASLTTRGWPKKRRNKRYIYRDIPISWLPSLVWSADYLDESVPCNNQTSIPLHVVPRLRHIGLCLLGLLGSRTSTALQRVARVRSRRC